MRKTTVMKTDRPGFSEVVHLIATARQRAYQAVIPSIGVLLCASKDDEGVEYALGRSLSPAMIAEYQTQLPVKKLLQAKLHEFYLLNIAQGEGL